MFGNRKRRFLRITSSWLSTKAPGRHKFKLSTVKPLHGVHLRFLKKVSAIRRCPVYRILDFFEEKYYIRVVVTVKKVNSGIGLGPRYTS